MQLDLFDLMECADEMEAMQPEPATQPLTPELNGFYYEGGTGLYVSYCLGRRHFQTDGVGFPGDWKKKIKKERMI
jgi:hypothetical protein